MAPKAIGYKHEGTGSYGFYFSEEGKVILGNTPDDVIRVTGSLSVNGQAFVNDYARIDRLRVGTSNINPGTDGILYVEGGTWINGALTLGGTTITATAEEINYVDGVSSNIQTQLNTKLSTSGNAASATNATNATNVAVTLDSGDATHYVAFVDATSGNRQIKTDAGLLYNPSENLLSATVTQANKVNTTATTSNSNYYPIFVADGSNGGQETVYTTSNISFNPSGGSTGNVNVTGEMWISGDVAIGHNSPVTDLHIVSSGDAADDSLLGSYALALGKSSDTAGHEVGLAFRVSSDQSSAHSPGGAIVFERKDSNSKGDLHFKMRNSTSSGGHILTRMTLDHDGKLGIGTKNPTAGVHIDVDPGGTTPQLCLDGGGANGGDIVVPDTEYLQIGHWDGSSTFTQRMVMDDNGRLGINETAPGAMLHIRQSSDGGANDPGNALRLEEAGGAAWWNIGLDNDSAANKPELAFRFADSGGEESGGGYFAGQNDEAAFTFTGQHMTSPSSGQISDFSNKEGMIVVSSGQYHNFSVSEESKATINESLPKISLSNQRNQKSAFGVVSRVEDPNEENRRHVVGAFGTKVKKKDNRVVVNSLGEGGIWITNINGNIENGDYITTCEIPGYGMKQDDDLLHNYTVAKITQDCLFDLNSTTYECEEIQHNGQTYRAAFVGCTYHCG